MSDFIKELKKIECDRLIYEFSKKSIEMYWKNQCSFNVEVTLSHYGFIKNAHVMASAWDLLDMVYLSVLNSSDYRHSKNIPPLGFFLNQYRTHENKHSAANMIKDADANEVFRILMGMTAEQFQFQNMSLIFEKFNRDYHILCAGNFEHRNEIDVEAIVHDQMKISVNEYISALLVTWGICLRWPDPLNHIRDVINISDVTMSENIEKIVRYYSCSYDVIRVNPLGKQLLYSKPFILTQRRKTYIASSLFLVAMTVANGLYWLIRDYYCQLKSQKFVNAFGHLFEDYIKELSSTYCDESEWNCISTENKKSADFYYDFDDIRMIVESKSATLSIKAKQQVPDLTSANTFFSNTIKEAYEQLKVSYTKLFVDDGIPTIKIILLYDDFSNTSIIEKAIEEIFIKDSHCFIMTIRELEMLLHLHKNDSSRWNSVVAEIRNRIKMNNYDNNIGAILDNLSIYENHHFEDERNYFQEYVKRL